MKNQYQSGARCWEAGSESYRAPSPKLQAPSFLKPRRGIVLYMFYIIVISTLVLFNIVIVLTMMNNIEITPKENLINLRFNAVAARALYSPACLAYEGSYQTTDGTRWRVYPGVVDLSKANRIPGCIRGVDYSIVISKVNETDLSTKTVLRHGSCPSGSWQRGGKMLVRIWENNDTAPGVADICVSEKK